MRHIINAFAIVVLFFLSVFNVHRLEQRIAEQDVSMNHVGNALRIQTEINDIVMGRLQRVEEHTVRDFFPQVSPKKEIDWVTVDVQRTDGSKVLRLTNTTKNTYTWMRLDRRAIDYLWQKLFRDESL